MIIFGLCNQTMAYEYRFIGIRGAIGGVLLPKLKQYATERGYKHVKTPFCHFDLEGTLYMEGKVFNHMGFRMEFGPRYMYPSFTGETDQNKTRQTIGLHCGGGHLSMLLYVYPSGIFADHDRWNGHIGVSQSFDIALKSISANTENKKEEKFSTASIGPALGIGFECISGLQLECRYRWLVKMGKSPYTTDLHSISLAIGYLLK